MKAVKLEGHVTKNHKLNLTVPEDVNTGPVEVILLVPEKEENGKTQNIKSFLKQLSKSKTARLSKEEIDQSLANERNGWDVDNAQNLSFSHA